VFKIGDFSRLSLVSVKALRYYDELGLLKPARVDEFTGYRYYSASQLTRLNRILAMKDMGCLWSRLLSSWTRSRPRTRYGGCSGSNRSNCVSNSKRDRLGWHE
jgi:hypothetical protein